MKTQDLIDKVFNPKPRKEVENVYIPSTLRGDRKRFWDNYNDKLINRISDIKCDKK